MGGGGRGKRAGSGPWGGFAGSAAPALPSGPALGPPGLQSLRGKPAGAPRHQPQAVRPPSQTSPASLSNHSALPALK